MISRFLFDPFPAAPANHVCVFSMQETERSAPISFLYNANNKHTAHVSIPGRMRLFMSNETGTQSNQIV